MKDNFSTGSASYKQFRPEYPETFFTYLYSLVAEYDKAWDCGTGNGQMADVLSRRFKEVVATDISSQQLAQATPRENILYLKEEADHTSAPDHCYDLITVAQAIHWFDFDAFYNEVRRTAKAGAILAVTGYGLMETEGPLNAVIADFYYNTVGPYWDKERRYIDERYKTIPFPFNEIQTPEFFIHVDWDLQQLIGYLRTWSAVKHYTTAQQEDPIELIIPALQQAWKAKGSVRFSFPLLLRVANL